MPTAIVCTNCSQRAGRAGLRCEKCGGARFREVSAASLQPRVSEKTRKAAHDQTYMAIARDHGKAAADKFWQFRKNAF